MCFHDALVLLLHLLPIFWPLIFFVLVHCLMTGTVLDGVAAVVERLREGSNHFGLGTAAELTFFCCSFALESASLCLFQLEVPSPP